MPCGIPFYIDNRESSWCQLHWNGNVNLTTFRHWLHRKLSKGQLSVQPVTIMPWKRRCFGHWWHWGLLLWQRSVPPVTTKLTSGPLSVSVSTFPAPKLSCVPYLRWHQRSKQYRSGSDPFARINLQRSDDACWNDYHWCQGDKYFSFCFVFYCYHHPWKRIRLIYSCADFDNEYFLLIGYLIDIDMKTLELWRHALTLYIDYCFGCSQAGSKWPVFVVRIEDSLGTANSGYYVLRATTFSELPKWVSVRLLIHGGCFHFGKSVIYFVLEIACRVRIFDAQSSFNSWYKLHHRTKYISMG